MSIDSILYAVVFFAMIGFGKAMKGFYSFRQWDILLPAFLLTLFSAILGWERAGLHGAAHLDWDRAKLFWAMGFAGYIVGCFWYQAVYTAGLIHAEVVEDEEELPHDLREPVAYLNQPAKAGSISDASIQTPPSKIDFRQTDAQLELRYPPPAKRVGTRA